jgi:phytoene dehydrogenase-like protein
MKHEVVVVGAGVGGLTVAALLAARGVDVCLLERQSNVGGCVVNFEQSGYSFAPTTGLYSGWHSGGIYETIFSELPFEPPQARPLSPWYIVRLPDGTEVTVGENQKEFDDQLRQAFPECAENALIFYRRLAQANDDHRAVTSNLLRDCSLRFGRFIDLQLQAFAQCLSDQLPIDRAARALSTGGSRYTIKGGAQALADTLAESIKKCGGTLRLNAPALRLAYGPDDLPIGVDLLSGERVFASQAIVSNLTIWDTFGKLVGLARTPPSVSSQIRKLHGWGSYLLFLSMDHSTARRLKANRMFVLTDWQAAQAYSPELGQFIFSVNEDKTCAPDGKLAVTVSTFTEAQEWFGFHQDQRAHEQKDQATLEELWNRMHNAMPELGDGVEVIETATPQVFYERTRRKFGFVGGLCNSAAPPGARQVHETNFPNLFLVGDTVCPWSGLEGISICAKALADRLRPKAKARRRNHLFTGLFS